MRALKACASLLIGVCFNFPASAQPYVPMLGDSTVWIMSAASSEWHQGWHDWAAGDTVLWNGHNYKRVYSGFQHAYVGFVREDTSSRRVYYNSGADTIEYVFYDFSLSASDSFPVIMPLFVGPPFYDTMGWRVIDSVVQINTPLGLRRVFHFHETPFYMVSFYVEGVGAVDQSGLVATTLVCAFQDDAKTYWGRAYDMYGADSSCIVGVARIESDPIKTFPNPANEWISISHSNQSESTITIYNLQGRQLLTTSDSTIVITHLSPGLYIMQACGDWGCAVGKFIKQ